MTVSNSSTTIVTNLMKKIYPLKMAEQIVVRKRKLLQYIEHNSKFTSTTMDVAIVGANNQRFGADFEMALSGSGAGGTVYTKYTVSQRFAYGFGRLSGQDIANFQNGGDESYFLDGLKNEYTSILESLGSNANKQAYRNGTGLIAQNSSGTSSPITLADRSMARHFAVGLAFKAGPNADGTSLRSGTGVVTKVSDEGVVTYTGTITSLAATDYLFNAADVSSSSGVPQGLDAYNPTTPSSSMNGVDQTTAVVQYAGTRYNAQTAGDQIDTCLGTALAYHQAQSDRDIDVIFMNPIDVDRLSRAKAGNLVSRQVGSNEKYDLVIEGFSVAGATVIPDGDCPRGEARGVAKGSFVWMTCGNVPNIDKADGLSFTRAENADAFDIRAKAYHNFVARAPNGLCKIILPVGS